MGGAGEGSTCSVFPGNAVAARIKASLQSWRLVCLDRNLSNAAFGELEGRDVQLALAATIAKLIGPNGFGSWFWCEFRCISRFWLGVGG